MIRKYSFIFLCACSLLIDPLTAVKETICKEFSVQDYVYNEFYDLSLVNGGRSDIYLVKLPVTFESDRGDIHVAFAESTETKNASRVYEFALGSYDNSLFEIRRKDYLHEKRDFNGNRFADYRVPTNSEFSVEFSISRSGVVQITEVDSGFRLRLVDQLPRFNVKFVSFAGYKGAHTKVKFDCVTIVATTTGSDSTTDEQPASERTSPPFVGHEDDIMNEIL